MVAALSAKVLANASAKTSLLAKTGLLALSESFFMVIPPIFLPVRRAFDHKTDHIFDQFRN
jgi:hypothetical protein